MAEKELDLPEGPVTIMFTDIEGSTALRTSLGDHETDELFGRHDEIVRTEIEANKGHDQKAALGDGFLAAFVSTRRAVACAIAIQRALDGFNRSRPDSPLRVRIGLNTGEVAQHDGQLSGEAVHAAARVCAAGEGGQILVSDVTRQLAGTIPDVTFRDTGEHQLKGFPQPWRLWDVVWVRETSAIPDQVFVGREQELATLRAKLSSALDGRGGLVLVGGEPGVGKTTLVRHLILEAEQRGALAVFGRCYESEGAVPYSPFVEMLEQALAIMPPDIVREDMGEDAPEVARMVPELRRRFPDIGEPLDLPPEQQRRYFFNAVGSFISRGAARFPLLLVMDDVHWADESTLLLIEHMAEMMPEMRVIGVGTYRDVELDVARPLAATMERLLRARVVERISVKRFDRDGVGTMLEALAGRIPPDVLVDAVWDETEGNPFFVEEVFRHLVEEGKVFDEDGAFRADIDMSELDVPESVRLVVGRRLERLGDQAHKVLAAGAVVGRGFPFSLLEEITEVDSGRLLDIVEEAEAARVIVPEERDGEIHYSFAHELIRQTLLTGVSLLRRQRLHLTVANAIERTDKRAREERPSEIAYHLMQAGAGAERDRTLEYLELAADRAIDAAAYEEALRAIEDALTLVPSDDRTTRASLRERLGWALRALGRFEDSLAIWDEVVDVYRDLGDLEKATNLCREMAYQYLWLGRFDQVLTVNQRGLDIIGDAKLVNRAYMIGGIGALLGLGGFVDEGLDRIAEAEVTAREFDDERALGWLNWTRSIVFYSNCRFAEAIELGRKAMDQLRTTGDVWAYCDAAAWVSLALIVSGRTAEAHEVATEGDELAERLGHIGAQILLGRTLILERGILEGDLAAYELQIQVDFDLCRRINSPWIAQSYVWMAAIAQLRGRIDEALDYIEKGIELEPPSAFTGVALGFKLLNRAYAGDRDELAALVDEVWTQLPEQIPAGIGPVILLMGAAQAVAILGLTEHAAKLYDRVRTVAGTWAHAWFDGALTQRVAGMIAALLNRWDEAEEHFRTALRQVEEVPDRLDEPRVRYWYARMLVDRGEPGDADRARELYEQALEGYRRVGMPLHVGWTEERLKALTE
jgi:class 3 adenylate cyclase/tetratricopeptide (TPR) repeat protein